MSNAPDVVANEWNQIIQFKIKESDLKKPDEQFLCNALISYLKMFDIDLQPLVNQKNSEEPESRRIFKIEFCAYINHLYKISGKSNQFLYYDLIKPSPKKTAHLLKILLNYLLYYNMVKEEIISTAQEKIKERDNIANIRNAFLTENEKNKIKAESIQKTIGDYQAQIPKLNEKIEKRTTENKNIIEKIKQIEETIKNYDNMLYQLKHNEEELHNDLVSENEVESLLAVKTSLQKSIAEQEEIEKVTISSNQETTAAIGRLQPCLKEIVTILEAYPLEDMTSATSKKAPLCELKQKLCIQQSINEKKNVTIKSNLEKFQELETAVINKSKKLNDLAYALENEIISIKTNIQTESKKNEVLHSKLYKLEESIREEKEFCEFIIDTADKVTRKFLDAEAEI